MEKTGGVIKKYGELELSTSGGGNTTRVGWRRVVCCLCSTESEKE